MNLAEVAERTHIWPRFRRAMTMFWWPLVLLAVIPTIVTIGAASPLPLAMPLYLAATVTLLLYCWPQLRRELLAAPCFPGDAMVLVPGGQRRMDSIAVGDEVLSWTEEKSTRPRRVTKVRHDKAQVRTVTLDQDIGSFRVTASHRLLSRRGWVKVSDLVAGDVLTATAEHRTITVMAITCSAKAESVYNLITEGEHTYLVGAGLGVPAHNFTYFRRLRTFARQLYERRFSPAVLAAMANRGRRTVSGGNSGLFIPLSLPDVKRGGARRKND